MAGVQCDLDCGRLKNARPKQEHKEEKKCLPKLGEFTKRD
jgi:hypothetical protein